MRGLRWAARRGSPHMTLAHVPERKRASPFAGNWGKTPGTQLQQNKGQSGSVTLPP